MKGEIALHELELELLALSREEHQRLRDAAFRAARSLGVERELREKLDPDEDSGSTAS